MLVRCELDQSAADLLAQLLVQSELTVLLDNFIKYVTVLGHLLLRREDLKSDDLIVDGLLEPLSLFLTVNNLGQLVSFFV